MTTKGKLLSLLALTRRVQRWRRAGRRIVFTNGCFDLLHAGHVASLEEARSLGDALIVGLNSDRSMRRLKGPARPLVAQRERARVLAGLACVDAVILFDAPTPARVIARLQPDVLAKGGDWAAGAIIGAAIVTARGGRVVRLRYIRGASTTALITRIVKRYR